MTNPATPAERLAAILLQLSIAVDGRMLVGWLARPLSFLILDRIRSISQAFTRLAGRIAAGRYAPRTCGPRRQLEKRPRRPNPLPTEFAWLRKLAPEATIAAAGYLEQLFADPEMAALLAAGPTSLRRPLRSLCRMLGVASPAVLALPPRPKRETQAPERKPLPIPERPKRPSRVRYVFGLRYPPPFPDPV